MPCGRSWPAPHEGARLMHLPVGQAPAELVALIEQLAAPVVLVDGGGRTVALNAAALALLPEAPRDPPFEDLAQLAEALGDRQAAELLVLSAKTLEDALRAPEEHAESLRQLNQAQEAARIGSWTADRLGMQVRFSDEQYRLYGLERSSEVDLESFLMLLHPDDREPMRAAVVRASRTGEPFRLEHRLADPTGPVQWIESRCEVVMSGTRVVRLVGTSYDITERKRYEQSLQSSLAEVRASRMRIVSAADEERRRVERDLHDGAQQRLVALTVGLRLAQAKLGEDDRGELAEMLERLGDELRLALDELRDLARGIHPAVLTEQGLAVALESLALRSPVPTELIECPDRRLPGAIETGVYYLVAEALTNTAKHAQASRATVSVSADAARVTVEVQDDGAGGASIERGSGLRGLADRVASLDGRLAVHSPPGGGTTLTAELPCA
jgi:PAS domain S-box-containing protein